MLLYCKKLRFEKDFNDDLRVKNLNLNFELKFQELFPYKIAFINEISQFSANTKHAIWECLCIIALTYNELKKASTK
jgi:hypothetical protein